ncbi:carbohydrate ABC transporter permease [Arthrobacter sp. AK01]|uniref:carbohydrate ABC transporter permease n=1 Tax=Arthrobacter sp. AK01 TaxID=2894084 RepID=UPI001E5EDE32|nr:carbohydrate ABC transporter permease [Arthrobacter sp. AK01]
MTTTSLTRSPGTQVRRNMDPADRGKWKRFWILIVVASVALVPIAGTFILSLRSNNGTGGVTLDNFIHVLADTEVVAWLLNSLQVTLATVVVSVLVAAPAGYVLSRGRSRLVEGYSLLLFVIQSLPVITSVIPLFILFSGMGLADNLIGITILYVASSMSVSTWMMASYMDGIPDSLEEAAWIDGASVFGSFWHIVMKNSLPGILSTAIFTFLMAWNDYLVASIFLRSSGTFTLPIGVQTFFQQHSTDWGSVMAVAVIMMLPPAIVFAALNKYFSVGGVAGSLAGR